MPELAATTNERALLDDEEIPAGAARPRTVLVVEDDSSVREVFARMLQHLGYVVLEAEGVAEATGILDRAGRVDLVLSDCFLSNGSKGWDLAKLVRGKQQDLPFLFITGHDLGDVEAHLPSGPTTRLMRKPFTLEDLDRELRETLRDSE